MIEAKFFTVGTYLYKYNLTVLFVSPSKIAHEKFYIYCPPLLLNEIYAHACHLYIYIYIYIYIYTYSILSIYPSIYLSVCLSVCLSVYLSILNMHTS